MLTNWTRFKSNCFGFFTRFSAHKKSLKSCLLLEKLIVSCCCKLYLWDCDWNLSQMSIWSTTQRLYLFLTFFVYTSSTHWRGLLILMNRKHISHLIANIFRDTLLIPYQHVLKPKYFMLLSLFLHKTWMIIFLNDSKVSENDLNIFQEDADASNHSCVPKLTNVRE